MTLKQAYPSEKTRRVQCAFKDSMIHWILQFTLHIAIRCVLHRCENQEIRCWKLYFHYTWHIQKTKRRVYWKHRQGKHRRLPIPSSSLRRCTDEWRLGFVQECTYSDRASTSQVITNDPSAGSPTETLLRLLLPLNDSVWSNSRHKGQLPVPQRQSRDLTEPFNR